MANSSIPAPKSSCAAKPSRSAARAGDATTWRTSPARHSPVTCGAAAAGAAQARGERLRQLEHRARRPARDVERARDRLRRGQREHVGAGDVAHVDEVAPLAAVLEHARRAAGGERRSGRCSRRRRTACRAASAARRRCGSAARSPARPSRGRTRRTGAPGRASSRRRRCAGPAARPRAPFARPAAGRRRGHGGSKRPASRSAAPRACRARRRRAPGTRSALRRRRPCSRRGPAGRRSRAPRAPAAARAVREVVVADVVGEIAEVDAEADHRRLVAHVRRRRRRRAPRRPRRAGRPRSTRPPGRGSPAARDARAGSSASTTRTGWPAREQRVDDVRADEARAAGDEDRRRHSHRSVGIGNPHRSIWRVDIRGCPTSSSRCSTSATPSRWVLERMPRRLRADRRRQRLDATARPSWPRGSARASSTSRSAASAPRASPGCARRAADVVCFMDCDASLDPRELPRVAEPVARRPRRPRARRPRAGARARGRCTRAPPTPCSRGSCAGARGVRAARPRPDARRAARARCWTLGSRDRRFGWPLEMVLRAAARGLARSTRSIVDYHAAGRGARRSPARCAGPCARCATWRRCWHERGAARDRQGAGARARQDAAVPAVHAGAGGGARRRRRCADTLARVRRGQPPARRVLVLDGAPGAWLPGRLARSSPSAATGSAERLAAAFADVGGPAFLVGMDTPQVTPAAARAPGSTRSSTPTPCSGPADDGGYWAIGLRAPDPARVRRRADEPCDSTGAAQRARLAALGLRTRRRCRRCATSTTSPRPARSRPPRPRRRFAAALAALDAGGERRRDDRPRRHGSSPPSCSTAGCSRPWPVAASPPRRASGSPTGARSRCRVDRWLAPVDAADRAVLAHAAAPVLDIGCGPGRHLAALAAAGHDGLGLDLSPVAVRLARARGADAILRSVFADVPRAGDVAHRAAARRQHRHRRRARARCSPGPARCVAPGGAVLVETAPPGAPTRRVRVRLETHGAVSPWFGWATVGADGDRRRSRGPPGWSRAAAVRRRRPLVRAAGAPAVNPPPGPFRPRVLALPAARPVADGGARLAAARRS